MMGLTTRDRQRKDSFRAVQKCSGWRPYFPLPAHPRVSVVVASFQWGPHIEGLFGLVGGVELSGFTK